MKLIESYCNSLSIDIPKKYQPNLPSQYFPCPDKYITIQNSSGMPAKDYDLYQEVIDLIFPYLNKENIEIVQIGRGEIKQLNKTINLINHANFAQTCYILNNSLLHFGNDSFATHVIGGKIPMVILFGSTSAECHAPTELHKKSLILESHRFGKNPTYQLSETPKTINLIKVEKVASAILDILGIEHNLQFSTIYTGDNFIGSRNIEIIPDWVMPRDFLPASVLNLRADLFFEPNLIIQNIQQRSYALNLDRPFDLNILQQLKPNIPLIVYRVDDDTEISYLKQIVKLGIQLQLWTKLAPDKHQKIKLNYLDLPLITRRDDVTFNSVKEKIKRYNNQEVNLNGEFRYLSKKHYLSRGMTYNSLMDWKLQNNVENLDANSRADLSNQDFLNEFEFFLLFQN